MGSVKTAGAAGFSSRTGAYYIDMAAAPGASSNFGTPARKMESVIPPDRFAVMPWSPWGTNNLLPQEMTKDIETCGILNTIIDASSRFAIGEGMDPVIIKYDGSKKVIDSYVDDPEIKEFLEMNNSFEHNFAWIKDLGGMGNGMCRFMLNGGKDKIVEFQRDDITECRFEKKRNGIIENVYHSAEWPLVTSERDPKIFKVPLLRHCNPLQNLRDKAKAGIVEHNMSFRIPGWGKYYYSVPLWYAAYKWVKIAQGVPEMKAAMFENNMRLKYMVIIYDKYWEAAFEDWNDVDDNEKETRRNQLFDEIDSWLIGSKNAYKSIFVDGTISIDGKPTQFIDIKPIDDTTKQGELLPDSAAANSEIAFAMLFNLAIVGGNQSSGLYESSQGGSNVRESVLTQVVIRELERIYLKRIYNVIKYFNGWAARLPGLEFVTAATVLTTLDSGSGSKPVNTGGVDNKKQPDGTDKNNSGS